MKPKASRRRASPATGVAVSLLALVSVVLALAASLGVTAQAAIVAPGATGSPAVAPEPTVWVLFPVERQEFKPPHSRAHDRAAARVDDAGDLSLAGRDVLATKVAPGRDPVFADTDLLINAQRGHPGALSEIRAGETYVTPNQFNEFMAGGTGRHEFLQQEGVQLFGGPEAGDVASQPGFQKTFGSVVGAQGRGDAALAAFARETGFEAVTMDRRLVNFIAQTLRDPNVPIRLVPR
jgi:hypothetical protein